MIIIYTDGSCLSNPGPGGFAFLILKNNTIVDLVCGCVDSNTTNNRAELTAVIEALEWCSTGEYKDEKEIIINTDSQYVQKGMTIWIHNWKRKNWNKVKNPDLWQKLDLLSQNKTITWNWVKAHFNNKYNNIVDELARKEASTYL